MKMLIKIICVKFISIMIVIIALLLSGFDLTSTKLWVITLFLYAPWDVCLMMLFKKWIKK